jgi:hypothetical protein
MPPTGSTFTDWQQVEKESRLLMDEDFSWSEPPQRRRRRITEEPIRARRRTAVREYAHEPSEGEDQLVSGLETSGSDAFDEPAFGVEVEEVEAWDQPTAAHSHFDEMMEQWNAVYGDSADDAHGDAVARAFDLSDPGAELAAHGARRTVVITGRGDERYMPAPRRRPSADLRFHERSSFSPDRAGLWAVLLGIALVIGALAH